MPSIRTQGEENSVVTNTASGPGRGPRSAESSALPLGTSRLNQALRAPSIPEVPHRESTKLVANTD